MSKHEQASLSRRKFLWVSATLPPAAVLAACVRQPASEPAPLAVAPTDGAAAGAPTPVPPTEPVPTGAPAQVAPTLEPTPVCGDDDDVTPPQTAGPFYTPNSPERASLLEPGMAGTRMVLTGTVMTTACQPVAGALLDFWHADDGGVYDNVGYRLRGHQFADEAGRYTLETIVPGLYPGRTRHFHVMVQAPNQPVLITQLYFPGEPQNDTDGIFNPALLMDMQDGADGKLATFNFVLDIA